MTQGSVIRASTIGIFLAAMCAGRLSAAEGVEFNRQIRPILARHCFACHGPDENERQAGLRLDVRDEALSPLESGQRAIVPKGAADSELIRRVTASDADQRMPPADAGPPLTPEQVELLRRWIDEGANYAAHWSFVKPRKGDLPQVRRQAWPQRPLDHFVLARLEAAGLAPSPDADRYQLIRRLSFDLRGLPPSPAEIDAFVADTSDTAYEKLVDRYLADPAYGERWARVWLDLARYADSRGYGSDPLRPHIWRYRDWVIDAFNRNLPFDEFTIEQLAGDLLPEPTHEQLMATAFHRNTMTNTEGGTDDEEFRVAAIKDRVDTTMQVWMGLTMGCAKCHNHKYEPISQAEYYQLFAFFNQSADADRGDESPTIESPTPEMIELAARLDPQIAEAKQRLAAAPLEPDEQTEWETQQKDATPEARKKVPKDVQAILDVAVEMRTDEQQAKLASYFRTVAPSLKKLRDELAGLEKQRPKFPQLPVMQELPADKRRTTHIMVKGNFLDLGQAVEPALPAALHPYQGGSPRNRLDVARWLVAKDNPLTARVAVNRFWSQLFGQGIVETEEDFGTQGTPPSHPQLLDWLAVEFMQDGWNIKNLLKRIVTSATYRQSSRVTPELLEKDPRNRLYSRGPRFRLEAEMVRDQALALSGLLSRKVGGPSVFPPQPPNLWQAAFNGERTWATSSGEDRYRRGLYTFWRRTVPYPSMATFDAPSRETCSVRRSRTNTPLQALVTLNDPVFVEAAQALARRVVDEGGPTPEDRARFALELCLCRPADARQVERLVALYRQQLQHYRDNREAATPIATDPLGPAPAGSDIAELAAWTVSANVLLNLDSVLTKN
jgi:hypothetical protein